jgi:hypothetical protein
MGLSAAWATPRVKKDAAVNSAINVLFNSISLSVAVARRFGDLRLIIPIQLYTPLKTQAPMKKFSTAASNAGRKKGGLSPLVRVRDSIR